MIVSRSMNVLSKQNKRRSDSTHVFIIMCMCVCVYILIILLLIYAYIFQLCVDFIFDEIENLNQLLNLNHFTIIHSI